MKTLPENGVHFCLRPLGPLERCGILLPRKIDKNKSKLLVRPHLRNPRRAADILAQLTTLSTDRTEVRTSNPCPNDPNIWLALTVTPFSSTGAICRPFMPTVRCRSSFNTEKPTRVCSGWTKSSFQKVTQSD